MKKVLATILAIVYFITSTGATVTIHYCMGRLYAVDLVHTAKCGKCGMEKDKGGCCNTAYKIIKLKDAHPLVSNQVSFAAPYAVLNNYQHISSCAAISVAPKITANNNSPPGASGTSLYILNSVFRL